MPQKNLFGIIPDVETLLDLQPEEIGGVILEILNSAPITEIHSANNFLLRSTYGQYPNQHHEEIARNLSEGWVWLESEGMLAQAPRQDRGWVFVTRRGRAVADAKGAKEYINNNKLPKAQLHPIISSKVWSNFLRGDHDTAVFQAFKEVEIRVREASELVDEDIGSKLMRKAFASNDGPLSDRSKPVSEQESLAHLFAGAIGLYKNPHSHRSVEIEAEEAAEMIMLASHLMNIVDSLPSNKL